MFPCAMSAGIVCAEARIVRLHLSEAYHGAPERLLFLSLNFCHFCLPLLFFFLRLPSFVQFLSFFYCCTLCLSLIRYLSFFLLFQYYCTSSKLFLQSFFAIFVKPLQRDQRPEVRQLHLLHMRSSARNAYIRPFVHPYDILKRTFSAPSVASFVTVRYLDVYFGKKTARKYKR